MSGRTFMKLIQEGAYAGSDGSAISMFAGDVLKRTLTARYIANATGDSVTEYDVPNIGSVISTNASLAADNIFKGDVDIREIEEQIMDMKRSWTKFEEIFAALIEITVEADIAKSRRSFSETEYRFTTEGKGQVSDRINVYLELSTKFRTAPLPQTGLDLASSNLLQQVGDRNAAAPKTVNESPIPAVESQVKIRLYDRIIGRIVRIFREVVHPKFRTDITFEELLKNSPDLAEMLIKEKESIKSPDGKAITIDAGKLAIQADGAKNLADGNMYQMPMGFGKTLTFRLAAYLLTRNTGKYNYTAKNNKGVLVSTSTNDLAMRDAEAAGKILSNFGVSVGFVGGKDAQGRNIGKIYDAVKGELVPATDDEVYKSADVIYGTIDTFVHRSEAEEMEYDRSKILFTKRQYFSMFDEADLALIYQLMTPFILSGGDKADADKIREKFIKAQTLVEMFERPGELIDISQEKAKAVTLTAKGLAELKGYLAKNPRFSDATDINNGDHMAWKMLLEQALAAKRCYSRGTDYTINDKKEIVMIGDVQEEVMPGRRWSFGLHAAIEAKHRAEGVAVSTEHVTKNATMLRTFLANKKLIADFSGASGTMDLEFMESVHRKKVVVPAIPELYVSKGVDYVHLHVTAAEKENELLEDIAKTYGEIEGGRPILIKVREGASPDLVAKLVARLGAGVRDKITEYTALSDIALKKIEAGSGKTGSITIVSNRAHRGVDIQLEEIVANNGGMVAYSTYMDEVEATDFQYRRRVARKIGEQGTWKGFWSLEDEVFSKHKKDASVVAAMDALKIELKRSGTPIVSQFGDKKDVVTALVAAVRRAIMASKIQQFGAESRFESEIESRKRQFLAARNAVLDGRFNDIELNDLVKDIGLIERYVAPDKKDTFRIKLLEKLDDAFSNYYLDKVGEVKHAVQAAIQDAKGLAVAARAEERKYLHFMSASDEAFRLAAAHVNTWISLEVIGMDKPLEELMKAELAPTKKDLGRRVMGFAFGGAIAAGLWYMMGLFMQAANVMSVLSAGGGAGKVMADKVIFGSTAQGIMSVLPNEAWLVLAPVMILLGLSLYRSQVNKFSEIYKDKENIGLVFKGIATPGQTVKAAGSIFVMGLMMLASFAPIGAIFAMISGVAFLQSAPVLIPVAAMIAGSGVISSLILTFLKTMLLRSTQTVASKEVKVTGMQRFFSGLNAGLAYLAGFSLLFIFSSSLSGLLMGSGLIVLAGVGSRALERIQYDRTIENTKAAMRTRLAGMTASGAMFLVLLAVAKLAGTSQNFMMAVSGIGAVIMMAVTALYLVGLPIVEDRLARIESKVLGGNEKVRYGENLFIAGVSDIRTISIGIMSGAAIFSMLFKFAQVSPYLSVSVAVATLASVVFVAAAAMAYRANAVYRIARGEKIPGLSGKFAEYISDSTKLTQTVMQSATLAMAGPGLSSGGLISQYAVQGESEEIKDIKTEASSKFEELSAELRDLFKGKRPARLSGIGTGFA
ncbi:MAG: hypothetical protein HQL30_09465, partial [Candidatus Omnitrophica bacterium]|nr:hypothetical protein [Candidatus Omnitrophota bacterium]